MGIDKARELKRERVRRQRTVDLAEEAKVVANQANLTPRRVQYLVGLLDAIINLPPCDASSKT